MMSDAPSDFTKKPFRLSVHSEGEESAGTSIQGDKEKLVHTCALCAAPCSGRMHPPPGGSAYSCAMLLQAAHKRRVDAEYNGSERASSTRHTEASKSVGRSLAQGHRGYQRLRGTPWETAMGPCPGSGCAGRLRWLGPPPVRRGIGRVMP